MCGYITLMVLSMDKKALFVGQSWYCYLCSSGLLKEVSLLSLQTDVETCAEGQTRALPPSWDRWLIGRLSVVRTLTRTQKTRSILGRRWSSACHFSLTTNKSFDHASLCPFVASPVHFGPSPKVVHLKLCSILIGLIVLIICLSS